MGVFFMKIVSIKNIKIGEGLPKIIIPLVGENIEQLIKEISEVKKANPDIVEWRADMLEGIEDIEEMKKALSFITKELSSLPLLFTFRTHREGGNKRIEDTYYEELLLEAINSDFIDLIDVELFSSCVNRIVEAAQKRGIPTIMSNHDFKGTPSKEVIIERLLKMQELGASIPKIAVMPQSPLDVLVLLEATYTMSSTHADRPIITMSMNKNGIISRLAGEVFGSAATFGAGLQISAPGQIPAGDLREILQLLH